jgi:putative membrane protein
LTALFAFLHHVAVFALVAALAIQFVLLRGELTVIRARQILAADMVLGVSASVVLLVGAARVFQFEKGATYYFHSIPFLVKVSVFVVVALLSIYPTLQFLSWRAALGRGQLPGLPEQRRRSIRMLLHLELAGIVVILLCAALMAKGVGSFA